MSHTHPRESTCLYGHQNIISQLTEMFLSKKMPHAVLLAGPKGIGKATLAYHFARYVLSFEKEPMSSLQLTGTEKPSFNLEEDKTVFPLVSARSHADLYVLEKGISGRTGRKKQEIIVDDARKLKQFFSFTAVSSFWRVAIIDAADEMNHNAANAILKSLEEPPKRTILILISHSHNLRMKTITSRCQRHSLHPLSLKDFSTVIFSFGEELSQDDIDLLFYLSNGSPGIGSLILENDGIDLYKRVVELLIQAPTIDYPKIHLLADQLSTRGSEDKFELSMQLLLRWISSCIKSKFIPGLRTEIVKGEFSAAERIISIKKIDEWVRLWEELNHKCSEINRLNLDRKQVLLSTFSAIGRLSEE